MGVEGSGGGPTGSSGRSISVSSLFPSKEISLLRSG